MSTDITGVKYSKSTTGVKYSVSMTLIKDKALTAVAPTALVSITCDNSIKLCDTTLITSDKI